MRLGRRGALLAVALPLAAGTAAAQQPQVGDTAAPIQALDVALLGIMHAGKSTPFMQRYNALAPAVDGAFDLPAILHASVGPRWSSLPPTDQQRLLDQFRKFTIASYVANFDSFSGERIEVIPGGRTIGANQVVQTRIVPANGDPTPIDYVMTLTAKGWRAVDVLLNGSISQVAVYRSDWRSSLASGARPLITNLQQKVADLSGGALS